MKIEVLKEYIQKVVREEIKSVLKEELRTQLFEILLGNSKNLVNERIGGEGVTREKSTSLSSLLNNDGEEPKQEKKPEKKFVKYTNNPILNEVMNEITNKIPAENPYVGYDGALQSGGSEQLNEVFTPAPVVQVPDNAPKEVKAVASAMTKDYRSLMKAVDKKRGIVK